MNVALRHRIMGIEDFLAWEARQEFKFEFDGFEPVAMTGGSFNHAAIQQNLALALGNRLRGGPCRFLGSDLKVVTGSRVRYPDGQVLCGPTDGDARFSTSPRIVFEVTSPGSEALDHGQKVQEYCGIPSVERYVILEQDTPRATMHVRGPTGWTTLVVEPGGTIQLLEIGIAFPLADLYEGVETPV